jgi:DNA-binding ferritin-like protein
MYKQGLKRRSTYEELNNKFEKSLFSNLPNRNALKYFNDQTELNLLRVEDKLQAIENLQIENKTTDILTRNFINRNKLFLKKPPDVDKSGDGIDIDYEKKIEELTKLKEDMSAEEKEIQDQLYNDMYEAENMVERMHRETYKKDRDIYEDDKILEDEIKKINKQYDMFIKTYEIELKYAIEENDEEKIIMTKKQINDLNETRKKLILEKKNEINQKRTKKQEDELKKKNEKEQELIKKKELIRMKNMTEEERIKKQEEDIKKINENYDKTLKTFNLISKKASQENDNRTLDLMRQSMELLDEAREKSILDKKTEYIPVTSETAGMGLPPMSSYSFTPEQKEKMRGVKKHK